VARCTGRDGYLLGGNSCTAQQSCQVSARQDGLRINPTPPIMLDMAFWTLQTNLENQLGIGFPSALILRIRPETEQVL
jgi:hypothetical protein